MPPVRPMLAKLAREMPPAGGQIYEPKWDGFRCIVFRDGDEVELGSRNEKPLTRYFPELVEPIKANFPDRAVVDGEIVITGPGGLDFEALLQRIHPAASRVRMLAEQTPASFVAFDALAIGDDDLRSQPFAARRGALEVALATARPPIHLTPATRDRAVAQEWFERFEGAGLDGVVAKREDLPYRENERVMLKVKHARTADCVVAGFRWHKTGGGIGSFLLGLYDDGGTLHHVGVASGFSVARQKQFATELEPYRAGAIDGHPWAGWAEAVSEAADPEAGPEAGRSGRMPGGQNRWNAKSDQSWEPVRPERVVEVAYDHLQGSRFRHATSFVRWRPDREPKTCTYSQLDAAVPEELAAVFGA